MDKPEILAPVGSWESLQAAIANGADAVYLGGTDFNARHHARNFGREELAAAVGLAHLYRVKVLVTVNTLLSDGELEDLADYLAFLYKLRVDGIIVQDLGVVGMVKKLFPHLPLHASTQMTVHNLEGARLLEKLGLDRVIPARELSLEEIRQLTEGTSLEVEVFVHGALCVCYSGQCLMSSLIWGRSGNRGRCAQPCRLEYTLIRKGRGGERSQVRSGYLLSTRDLKLMEFLPELCRAGVASFKIEGRMKRPEYVATVVRLYRDALDGFLADPANYQVTGEERDQLIQVFNRGFTTGYLSGQPQPALVNFKRPNHRGLLLGRVETVDGQGLTVKLNTELEVGDELQFWVSRGGRVTHTVERMWVGGQEVKKAQGNQLVELAVKGQIRPGDRVFKVKAAALERQARESYLKLAERGQIPVRMSFFAREGEPAFLVVEDGEGNRGEAHSEFIVERAKKRPLTREMTSQQLLRLGGTPFFCRHLDLKIEGEVMVPFSQLNEMRRQAIEKLEQARLAAFEPYPERKREAVLASWQQLVPRPRKKTRNSDIPRLAVSVNSRDKLQAAVTEGAQVVYLGGEAFFGEEELTGADLEWAVDYCRQHRVELFVGTPRIARGNHMKKVKEDLQKALAAGAEGVLASNLGILEFSRERLGLTIAADYYFNLWNSLALGLLHELGVGRVTLSPELTFEQVEGLVSRTDLEVECLVAGKLPLMVTEHHFPQCLPDGDQGEELRDAFYLEDRKGVLLPLLTDYHRRMHIFNARELCLIEDIPRLAASGVDLIRVEGRNQGVDYVRSTTSLYRQGLDDWRAGRYNPQELLVRAEEMYPEGITKGHYYRGVE